MTSKPSADDHPPGSPSNAGALGKLYWAVRNPPIDPTVSFNGKTVLVTGANTGLGFQAAFKYAALGASRLILGVRSIHKGEAAKKEIVRRTGCRAENITVLQADLSTFASVQAFVEQLNALERLDVALLNAGLATPTYSAGPGGWEIALQVNVLSTALLAILLLPKLHDTASRTKTTPHLSFVNSVAHQEVTPDWLHADKSLIQQINDPTAFDDRRQYALVKLASSYVTLGLLETLRPKDVIIINAACPGLCRTDLGRDWPWYSKLPVVLFQAIFARTAEQGSRTLVSATALGAESNGKLWTNDTYAPISELVSSEKGQRLRRQTWGEIVSILKQHAPQVETIMNGGTARDGA